MADDEEQMSPDLLHLLDTLTRIALALFLCAVLLMAWMGQRN
jgi:hypothetical protein